MQCKDCLRTDGKHETRGTNEFGEKYFIMDSIRCKDIMIRKTDGKVAHCPNNAPIGGGGRCGPCRWFCPKPGEPELKRDSEGRIYLTDAEMAMETLILKT